MMIKILRAIGLILFIAGGLITQHAYKNIYIGGRADVFLKTLGSGEGSLYRVCGKDDKDLDSIASVGFEEKRASNLKYHFYNIENPEKYLSGDDAIAVEKGPYMLKKHSIKYGVGFKASTMTDSGDPLENGAIEYNVANVYVPLDKNIDVTATTMTRDEDDLSLSWSSTERKTVASYDKAMPSHLSMTDKITNLSPIYQSIIGEVNDEFTLVLSMVCTPNQIANIFLADTKPQCSDSELNDMDAELCSCCMLRDMFEAEGEPADHTACDEHLDESGYLMSELSLLAYYDGGVVVKEAGEAKYSGDGNFVKTMHLQTSIYSPIIQSHTVNDILFGRPSAYVGKVVPMLYFAEARKAMKAAGIADPTATAIATELLTGGMVADLPFELGDIASYTKKVGAVCFDTCDAVVVSDPLSASPLGFMCDGFAPERHDATTIDAILLGGIDCKPYSATYATMDTCNAVDSILVSDPSAAGFEACVCANGSQDYKTSGCCLASGKSAGLDLTANGCLYPVEGVTGPNYVGKYTGTSSAKPKVDLGEAVEALIEREHEESKNKKHAQFMCPAEGLKLAEHAFFGRYEAFGGSDSHVTYHYTGNPRMRQTDASDEDVTPFSAGVSASSTQHFPGTGLTGYFNEYTLTYGHTFKQDFPVFIEEMKAPVMFAEDWGLRPIVCDDDLCHVLARLKPSSDAFAGTNVTNLAGIGLPFNGLQAIGSMQGPSNKGRPTYYHHPLYLNGDIELFTQQKNTHVDAADGNGIKIYRPSTDTDPGSFTVGGTNSNYLLIDSESTETLKDFIESYIDLEPATGLGIRSNLRFGVSHSLWECDPESNAHCKLAKFSDDSGKCYGSTEGDFTYPCSASNIFSPDVIGGKIIPSYWVEDKRKEVDDVEVGALTAMASEYHEYQMSYGMMVNFGIFLAWTLGFPLLFQVACFAPEKEFLKSGPVGEGNGGTTSSTASTSEMKANVGSIEAKELSNMMKETGQIYATVDGVEVVDLAAKPTPELKKDEEKKAVLGPLAPASAVFTAFGKTRKVILYRWIGIACSVVSGSVYPVMAFYFSKSFEQLGASTDSSGFLGSITEMLIVFIILGIVGFTFLVWQSFFLEISASESTADYKIQWFNALLRQDMAYYDIKDVAAQATVVSASAAKYKKGTGRKLGEGVQFTTTVIGGFVYAFYASWRVSLVILAVVPLMAGSAAFMMTVTTKQTERKNKDYQATGGIVYSTISSIRTVFSLNASEHMIANFKEATKKAFDASISFTYLVGFGSGAMMASFLVSYIALTLYGSYLLYSGVEQTGCDPSNTGAGIACKTVGQEVFGALMGISFGAMGLAQIANAVEAFMGARAACHPALAAINRTVGADEEYVENIEAQVTNVKRSDTALPKYVIDSSSDLGKKPTSVGGEIEFHNVSFAYPTRPDAMVFNGLSLKIKPGQTVALVGPSGGGKSTTVSMLERFYDPTGGSITLDGTDLRELNVQWLRDNIGLVAQEPVLFARTIKENIAYGMPGATDEAIINVAKSANAHDFIMKFPNGYETHVGDKGAQLSGGQKQRIAISRILLKNPKILLLDEATSALDSESEYVVQEALDGLLGKGNSTTIVIAHRLSTIRNADMIAVVKDGRIVETGTHDELLSITDSEYGKLVAAQAPKSSNKPSSSLISSGSATNLKESMYTLEDSVEVPQILFRNVHFHYPTRPNNEIFKGLTLNIKQGETLAIVGPSGGGKSTIVQMIERFYDPLEGSIEYEGTDLRELNIKWYRDQIGFVSQEPTLFNTTIAENIKYGYPEATQEEIEAAARKANAHDFIMSFPHGYSTEVGENATQVSGGQKQRIAISRAILKNPKILLLDEATSALDTESERVVQNAIDNLMASKNQTIIVIAHRLSTIQSADRIAVIADGLLKEVGNHDELMAKPNGRYKRLVEFQSMTGTEKKNTMSAVAEEEDETGMIDVSEHNIEGEDEKEKEKKKSNRARLLAKSDTGFFLIGSIGAVLAGLVFPMWGVVFAFMIELLFRRVDTCDDGNFETEFSADYASCQDYWESEADAIQTLSFNVSWGWLGLIGSTLIGNVLLFYGFGTATERMNKRVRDAVFTALMRQDITYYDTHSVAKLATQIEDDAAMIHSFSGEPIRTFVMSSSSVLVGLILSFVFMWPFAALTLLILPFLGFGAYMEMKMYMGEDEGADAPKEGEDSAGGIVVETLLSIRTVASLAIEKMRAKEYAAALQKEDPLSAKSNFMKGLATGAGFLVQIWGMGLMFWWGGYLLNKYPDTYSYRAFLISMFSLLFSLSGMSVAVMGATDQVKAKLAAERIFSLLDRESPINSLSDEGKKGV